MRETCECPTRLLFCWTRRRARSSLNDVAKDITCPFLVTHGGNDRVVPVGNAPKLYEAVGAKNKTIKMFSTEEGGAEHARIDNRQVGIDFAADWLMANM